MAVVLIALVLLLAVFHIPYTRAGIKITVKIWEHELTAFATAQMEGAAKHSTQWWGYKATVYPVSGCVFFECRSVGYTGFFYSESGEVVGFQGTEVGFAPYKEGWLWKEVDGDNWMYVEHITGNWFWYEMHF